MRQINSGEDGGQGIDGREAGGAPAINGKNVKPWEEEYY